MSVAAGYQSVCAVPMRLRNRTMGCLNLFVSEQGALDSDDVALAEALAHVASIAIALDRTARESVVREDHLRHALESRIVIEQAKGIIAAQSRVNMDTAFTRLRSYARSTNRRLTEVAGAVIDGSVTVGSGAPALPPPGRATGGSRS